jgi:hypothetical protein
MSTAADDSVGAAGSGAGDPTNLTAAEYNREQQRMMRERQWLYLGPIMAAPIAHISVTMYRHAKTQRQRQLIVGVGIVGASVAGLGMRLGLMAHAG